MDQTVNRKSNNKVIVLNKIKTYFSKPQNIILLLFGIVLTFTTVAPIVAIVKDTLMIHPGTIDAHLTGKASGYTIVNYVDLFTSRLARTNLWKPLWNTLLLAVLTCLISILYGGVFAFLVTRTNLKFKKYLSSIFIFPYIMPQWTLAVVWQNLFNSNAVVGTANGLLASLFGILAPKWVCQVSWGFTTPHLPISSSAAFSATWMPIWRRRPPFSIRRNGKPCSGLPFQW